MRSTIAPVVTALTLFACVPIANAAEYAIDPAHTFVTFEIDHLATSTNRGRFDGKQGSVQFDRSAKIGKVDITVDTTSLNTGVPAFTKHLNGPDLLDTSKYPTARFVADKFTFNGDMVSEVSGMLTLMGKTNPVTMKAIRFNCYVSPMVKREVCGGDFETTFDRTQFGLNYGVEWGFSKNVHLLVQIEALKQE